MPNSMPLLIGPPTVVIALYSSLAAAQDIGLLRSELSVRRVVGSECRKVRALLESLKNPCHGGACRSTSFAMMTRQIARDDDETNCSLGISFLAVQRAPDFSVRLHAARHRAGGDALSDKVN